MKYISLFLAICLFITNSCSKEESNNYNNFSENSGKFVDERDGHEYKWIKIGTQIWMAENLAYLPSVSGRYYLKDVPNYWVYGALDEDVVKTKATSNYGWFGVLYDWKAACEACPNGWHLPRDSEWGKLSEYLSNNGYGYEGSEDRIAKSLASKTNWENSQYFGTPGNDPENNNKSGFAGLPGGARLYGEGFGHLEESGFWWSYTKNDTSNAFYRKLHYTDPGLHQNIVYIKNGLSVRCIKDNE